MHTCTHHRLDTLRTTVFRRGSRFACNTCLSARRGPGAVTHIFVEQRVANTVSSSSTCYRQVHLLPRVLSTLTRTIASSREMQRLQRNLMNYARYVIMDGDISFSHCRDVENHRGLDDFSNYEISI